MSRRFTRTLGVFLPLPKGEGRGEGGGRALFSEAPRPACAPFPLILTFSPKGEKEPLLATLKNSASYQSKFTLSCARKMERVFIKTPCAFLPLPLGGEGRGEGALLPAKARANEKSIHPFSSSRRKFS